MQTVGALQTKVIRDKMLILTGVMCHAAVVADESTAEHSGGTICSAKW